MVAGCSITRVRRRVGRRRGGYVSENQNRRRAFYASAQCRSVENLGVSATRGTIADEPDSFLRQQ